MQKSSLLLAQQPIVINKDLAKIIGLNEAIVLQQIEYWVNINETAQKQENFKNGFYWTYNTISEWQEQFPFWSYDTVKRTLKKLRKLDVLIAENHNRKGYDRTLWYRIDYEKLNELEKEFSNRAKCTNEINQGLEKKKTLKPLKTLNSAKCPNAIVQNAPMQKCKMHSPIPEITTKITTKTTSSSSSLEKMLKIFTDNICELRKTTAPKFIEYVSNYNKEFVQAILEYCAEINIRSFAGFKKVIDTYIDQNILTKEEFIQSIEKYRASNKRKNYYKKKGNNSTKKLDSFTDYDQRIYSSEDLAQIEEDLLNSSNENYMTEEMFKEKLRKKNKAAL